MSKIGKKGSLLSCTAMAAVLGVVWSTGQAMAQTQGDTVETVTVTAEKRSERLQDVPVPVSVIMAQTLVTNNAVLLRDFFTTVPGLNLSPDVQSGQVISIRGITAGDGQNPSVGITVDDVPYGASTDNGGSETVPDLDPGELQSIEVLRGPQGTLYGASSMGGLIKFTTIDPSTDGLSGNIQAGVSSVYNGAEPGYNLRGAVNVPLSDDFAVRISAFTRQDPGYIDNPVLGIKGINEIHGEGAFFSALWTPTTNFSLKFTALAQDLRGNGSSDVDVEPGLGDLQQNYLPHIGGYNRTVQAYALTAKENLGDVEVTSITGFNVAEFKDDWDLSALLGPYTYDEFGVPGTYEYEHNSTDKVTEELRFNGTLWSCFDWLLGGFYTKETSNYNQLVGAESPTGQNAGTWVYLTFPTNYQELALFGDVTWHITDQFDIQVGARGSKINQSFQETDYGINYNTFFLGQPSPVVYEPLTHSSATPFTYLFTPRYKVSPDLMIYVRLASGYRAGGPNGEPGVPATYQPDSVKNYEIGFKGELFGDELSYDASLYYIDWKDIQLSLLDQQTDQGYTGNAAAARSDGIELSIEATPLHNMTVSAWATYDDAELTQSFPAAALANGEYALAGYRLPFSARLSGYISINQDIPLDNGWTAFVGGAANYVGNRLGDIGSTSYRSQFPAYGKVDLRVGVKSDSWTVNAYVNNVGDTRALLGGGVGYYPNFGFQVLTPRTIGINFQKNF